MGTKYKTITKVWDHRHKILPLLRVCGRVSLFTAVLSDESILDYQSAQGAVLTLSLIAFLCKMEIIINSNL
ncbi:hypothetical protein ACQP3J_32050, partial [Escherichia coli]